MHHSLTALQRWQPCGLPGLLLTFFVLKPHSYPIYRHGFDSVSELMLRPLLVFQLGTFSTCRRACWGASSTGSLVAAVAWSPLSRAGTLL